MATVTKRELAVHVSGATGCTRDQAARMVDSLFQAMRHSLTGGSRIEIRGFGVFQVKRRKKGLGRNPNKPEEVIPIPEKNVPDFKPGKIMKEKVEKTTS